MSSESTTPTKLSPVEGIKESSRFLRGTIAEELANPELDHLSEENKQLLKFHGSYQQEDRDARKNRAKAGVGKHYMFMIRLKLPGGRMTAKQYLDMDRIAGELANGTLRLTTRQSIQLHGILKANLKPTIVGINETLLSTLGACGDINRNVMSCPAPFVNDPVRNQMNQLCDAIAEHLAPRTKGYFDVWLNGEHVAGGDGAEEFEPIYGKVFLPRKFKIGFSLPNDNCVDIYAQDLGFLAIVEDGKPIGYNVMVGGGFGRTVGKPETFAVLSKGICFATPDQVVAAAEAVVKLYRDHGNRGDRKRARIKYLVADWGVEKFREVLAGYLPFPLVLPKDAPITGVDLHHGWQPQGDGKWFLGLSIQNGRIKDEDQMRLRSGLRDIVATFQTDVRITPQQDVLLCNIETANRAAIDSKLAEYGIPRPETLSVLRKFSMACPAIPTCSLAISESERALPALIDTFEKELAEMGLGDEAISIRMTGCPNGCARPYNSDIGLVGRSGEKYTVYVGGGTLGDRLNFILKDLVLRDQIIPTLKPLLERFKAERQPGEGFGGFCARLGMDTVRAMVGAEAPAH
ncbi:NADPH-dependent assimilatory sulfite reductase hemoprotein subunit [Tuwongella immobilis]|uniref:Nitrite/sulphite reductase 4Fe-4S domain-containing protein n=1 Tax=Tuwongella immobilis TaxID=692036 RepID=A0A6C2YL80_9BACT|nr:NADPH-dependent assimilatory sulfite reductase hemoprotein subunit [Tuwongella immobilis]VIP01672.1 sulfite reductase : Sulfite reductase (NADPH) beta subunit OS=Isosphaera pallida (strain ATCC 43644 / DSM 9630 / IS1B) GN=Isop_1056 PE=4 SV=1: NIR_SIR_ferr: NIR_SIR: NIR_SIR_ferr: NIR_SIR [Tuwongella immobilis]VTR99104.1 sulfite reductase : Sulfite reductase (NADPH) beta subunit OS=Isosphaera pallida (strain ATCC 43644 / DSM 9630 / IS1B) GN=Isop_1056 PE=4 SV=1: NIR_SIR_ferr: NIR_SIR: NIR_SIR_fer